MAVTIQVSQVIDRPISDVFHFYADEHVRNHPRWDPDIHLENPAGEPLGVGAVLRRKNSRSGTPVEGTMEVVEFERDRAFGMLIHDGPAEMRGRTTFEFLSPAQTRVTVTAELPGMDPSTDTTFFQSRMQRSVDNMKRLVESEL
jgi:hypothetical protein